MSVGSEVVSFGPWGGSGGDPWSFIATNGIAEITIYSGDVINSILFKDANGVISGTFGGRSPDPNDLGTHRNIITIHWPSEYLMSISGSYGQAGGNVAVGSLSFVTNLTTYGPFGTTNNGQAFSIPIADSVVVGFHGRAGYYLDALGILVQPVNLIGSVTVGPWGGEGGDSFSFKVDPTSYIKQITVSHGGSILSISFKDGDGHEYGPYGGLDPNDKGEKAVIEIDGAQRLTSISGTYGNYKGHMVITSLSFVINSNINGPYGSQTGTAFSIPIQGSEVVGFHGSAGWYLDSIGIYVKPRASSKVTVP